MNAVQTVLVYFKKIIKYAFPPNSVMFKRLKVRAVSLIKCAHLTSVQTKENACLRQAHKNLIKQKRLKSHPVSIKECLNKEPQTKIEACNPHLLSKIKRTRIH